MNERVIVIFDGGTLGPFDDEDKANTYLGLLEIKGRVVTLTTPPSMSDQLSWALTHIRLDGEDLEGFLKRHESEASEQALRDAFAHAVLLNRLAILNEDFLSNAQLAIRLYHEYGNNKLIAIKELRNRRYMGLREAKYTLDNALSAAGITA